MRVSNLSSIDRLGQTEGAGANTASWVQKSRNRCKNMKDKKIGERKQPFSFMESKVVDSFGVCIIH
jgi:hypothetical protein